VESALPLRGIVSIPGALARYRQRAPLRSPLTTVLLAGTLPGVIAGAVIRVLLIPGPQLFRLFVATLILPLDVIAADRELVRWYSRSPGWGPQTDFQTDPLPTRPSRGSASRSDRVDSGLLGIISWSWE
jgi:uncharacterized membrane protein YfcA